jgi:uncharacterized protein (DUF4415 family)
MENTNKIESSVEAWEDGSLGRDEQFVSKVDIDRQVIDDSLELQLISIRMQKGLLEDLKDIAQLKGIGYQPLMKQILRRFVDAEKKFLLREAALQDAKKELEETKAQEERELIASKNELRRA